MKVYEAIAQSLIAEGLTDFFGLMGDGNMWLWGALCRNPSVKPYNARHEAMAVSMADGYARTTGKVGIAMVTCGPGLTQCGTSLIAAYRGKTPIVLIAGEIEAGAKNSMQSMDQRRFAEASSARFHTITSIDNMAEEIAEAFYAARLHRGPIVLNLPMDLQEEDFDWDYEYRPSMEFLPPRMETPSPDQLAPVIEKLIAAERPVIIAGRGARAANAKDEIVKLADRVGALLATSLQGKGYFAGHPWDIGIAGAFASAPSEQLLADADFVLGVGAELGYYTTEGGLLFPSAEVARIDIKPMPEQIGVIPGLYVQGDGRKAVAAINDALEARQVRKEGLRTAATKAVIDAPPHRFEAPKDGLDPRALAWNLGRRPAQGGAVHLRCRPLLLLGRNVFSTAGGRGDPVLVRLRRSGPGNWCRDRHRCRQSRIVRMWQSRVMAACCSTSRNWRRSFGTRCKWCWWCGTMPATARRCTSWWPKASTRSLRNGSRRTSSLWPRRSAAMACC